MKTNKIQHTKKALIEALEKSLGIVTTACKIVKCDRSTFYKYINEDKAFAKEVKLIDDLVLDFVESKLHKQISNGNPVSTIFYMKTKGKSRGYVERQEFDHTTKGRAITTSIDLSKLSEDILLRLKQSDG